MRIRSSFVPSLSVRARALAAMLCLVIGPGIIAQPVGAQSLSSQDRERGHVILDRVKDDLLKNYYDPTYRGMDVEARFKVAEEKMKQATSLGQVFGIIGQALLDLNDSHSFFIPPMRASRTDYGWQMQMIGDLCYVTAVRPGSDAEAKGLKVGDAVLTLDGYSPTRNNLWKMQYSYYVLRPRPGMRLLVQGTDGKDRQLDVMAKVIQGPQLLDFVFSSGININNFFRDIEQDKYLRRSRLVEMGDELLILKMHQFDMTKQQVDEAMDKARRRKALILDLRGNGGGYEETMLRLIAHFFDRDMTIGELKRRKETKPLIAKKYGGAPFKGQLVVLVDSNSGSAAELFARVIQLEKRGTVIGDRTSGAVMRSKAYQHELGVDIVAPYAVSITDADIIMTDGKSLEKVGVAPDELLLPTGEDLAAKRDPVLSRAAALVGVQLSPEKAGALFPIEWKK